MYNVFNKSKWLKYLRWKKWFSSYKIEKKLVTYYQIIYTLFNFK